MLCIALLFCCDNFSVSSSQLQYVCVPQVPAPVYTTTSMSPQSATSCGKHAHAPSWPNLKLCNDLNMQILSGSVMTQLANLRWPFMANTVMLRHDPNSTICNSLMQQTLSCCVMTQIYQLHTLHISKEWQKVQLRPTNQWGEFTF